MGILPFDRAFSGDSNGAGLWANRGGDSENNSTQSGKNGDVCCPRKDLRILRQLRLDFNRFSVWGKSNVSTSRGQIIPLGGHDADKDWQGRDGTLSRSALKSNVKLGVNAIVSHWDLQTYFVGETFTHTAMFAHEMCLQVKRNGAIGRLQHPIGAGNGGRPHRHLLGDLKTGPTVQFGYAAVPLFGPLSFASPRPPSVVAAAPQGGYTCSRCSELTIRMVLRASVMG
ncbi:hypothetical protein B0H17DRAFT_1140921 [Mycena rosella]|uniref:Uncharacterized protein n=1 Tax=Mycena rosella TaxID=1033263 RepID=A0AAD7D1D3_MYCRO|nr:hypothetical protein B0H17DRAFT_1140921 [Mycena rosella]